MRRTIFVTTALALALAGSVRAQDTTSSARTLVSYEQSGGIAGNQTSMSVTQLGAARLTSSRKAGIKRFKLTADELSALKRDLRDARFSTLRSLYDSKVPVADAIAQIVRYAGRRVTVSTGGRPPERLRRVLTRLSRLATRAG